GAGIAAAGRARQGQIHGPPRGAARQLLAEDRAEVAQVPARARGEGQVHRAVPGARPFRARVGLPVPARMQLVGGEVVRALWLAVPRAALAGDACGTRSVRPVRAGGELGDEGDGPAAHGVDLLAHVRPAVVVEADRLD